MINNKPKEYSDKEYWNEWPLPCPYIDDLNWACNKATNYLIKINPMIKRSGKTGCIVVDIDDTIVMGDPAEVVGVQEMELGVKKGQEIFILPVNNQVKDVMRKAEELGYKIVILTARPSESRLASILNLKMFDVPFHELQMKDKKYEEDDFFKIKVRRSLETKTQTVILTMGDQIFDCYLPGTSAIVKLPDPENKCSYFYSPY